MIKEPFFLKDYIVNSEVVKTKILYNSFMEDWQVSINGKVIGNFLEKNIAIFERDEYIKRMSDVNKINEEKKENNSSEGIQFELF